MKKRFKKRYIVIGVIILLIAAAIIIRKTRTKSYARYTVEQTTVSDELLLAGLINAQTRVDLGFASSGRVSKVNFEVGDSVKKGDVIAEIEQNRLAADLSQAQANLTLTRVDTQVDTESATESLEKQIEEQDVIIEGLYREYLSGDLQAYNINENERNVSAPIVTGTYLGTEEGEYILDMYSSSANSGYSFRLSGLESGTYTAESERAGRLATRGLFIEFIDGEPYGNTDWVVPVPNTRSNTYASRKRAYESALATRARVISDLENNVERVSGVDQASNISREQARRNQAQAQVSAVAAQLGDGKIRAPFDGIIAKHDLEVGEIVSAFTPLVTMFENEIKELELNTPEIYINKIEVGDEVTVTLDAYNDSEYTGRVRFIDFIDTEVDGVPVYETDVELLDNDPRIRVGMNAKARIISDQRESVLAIPRHYIQENNGNQTVLIQTNDVPFEYEERTITTGFIGNDGLVEITSGLNQGDIILLETRK
ncbi:MAG: efflux RND transporter periplasmic adaptor subunit [Candidatus Pacebacteria bacterium]|nr:efflux RND transporter periplasmic adaptor subunit [Candidatus Paceibacterota bacterium]